MIEMPPRFQGQDPDGMMQFVVVAGCGVCVCVCVLELAAKPQLELTPRTNRGSKVVLQRRAGGGL